MLTKEQFNKLFEKHITVHPWRYACAIPIKTKKKLVKKKAPTTAEQWGLKVYDNLLKYF